MEHASDVLSPRPVQTPQELNLEKLAKRKTKRSRLSFKEGTDEYKVLDQVIKCWLAKEGEYWPGQSVGTREYLRHIEAKAHGLIKKDTLAPYLRKKNPKVLGEAKRGRKGHMTPMEEEVLIGTVMIADRINDGDVRKVVLEKVAVLKPELSRNQQQQAWRTASAHARQEGHLKQTQVKSQATTTARSACTVEQQWRWHQLINHVDDEHRKLNVSDDTGVDFMEVEAAFKVNGDEEGLLACANDGIKAYGCGSRDKHEKNTQDSRDSISLFKCGSAAGWSGPTIFLLKGKKAPVGLDSAYLVNHGGAPGSDVHMTQNAYMSKEAWEGGGVGSGDGDDVGISRKIAAGIRKMPVIIDHPDWWASKNRMCLVSSGLATTRHLATPSPQGACPQGGHPGRRRGRALTTASSP